MAHADYHYVAQWGSKGSGDGQFDGPSGIAIDGSGHVFVSDIGNHRIQEFASNGAFVRKWGSEGDGNGQFDSYQWQGAVATTASGDILVADNCPCSSGLRARVQEFSPTGSFVRSWGLYVPPGFSRFNTYAGWAAGPGALAVGQGGHIYVVALYSYDDCPSACGTYGQFEGIERFDPSGGFEGKWGAESKCSGGHCTYTGDFSFVPGAIAVSGAGHVFVSDAGPAGGSYVHPPRVDEFDSNGNPIRKWPTGATVAGLAVDSSEHVFTTLGDTVHEVTAAGAPVEQWGSSGSGEGQFQGPTEIAVDSAGHAYVVDTGNSRIEEFAGTDHYRIELQAWIPKAHAVDPLMPFPVPYALLPRPGCFIPPTALDRARAMVSTTYRGDAHAGFDGTFRVRPWIEFDWNGSTISNFRKSPDLEDYGTTHLDWTYTYGGHTHTCTTEGKATKATTGVQKGDDAFELTIASANPLVVPQSLTPNIDSGVDGTLAPDGAIHITYSTDLFPSHGIRVYRNGKLQATDIVNDPSCLSDDAVLGPVGVGALLYGLTHQVNNGSYDVLRGDSGRFFDLPSQMCDPGFFDIEVTGGGSGKTPRALTGLRSISIARITKSGVGSYVSLQRAAQAGLVSTTTAHGVTKIVSSKLNPVAARVTGSGIAVETTDVSNGAISARNSYGPVSGELVAKLGSKVKVTGNNHAVAARPPDRTPPVTRATVTVWGKRATIRFRARDDSGVLGTYVTIGSKSPRTVKRGRLHVRTKLLGKIRFGSVDVFGNRERLHRLPRRRA